jgi:hypothetical protein
MRRRSKLFDRRRVEGGKHMLQNQWSQFLEAILSRPLPRQIKEPAFDAEPEDSDQAEIAVPA